MKALIRICSGLALLLTSSLALAGGPYIGGGLYQGNIDDDISGFSLDDDDLIPALFAGYRIIDMVAVEAGIFDLGDYSHTDGLVRTRLDARALTLAGKITLPVGLVDLYGKGGVAIIDGDASLTFLGVRNKQDIDGEDPFAAIGVSFGLLGLNGYAEYVRFDTDVDIDMIGVGVRYDF